MTFIYIETSLILTNRDIMTTYSSKHLATLVFTLLFLFQFNLCKAAEKKSNLEDIYNFYCQTPYSINEHLPTLKMLAQECTAVIEIGVESVYSTWGILYGLSESSGENRTYLGIDIASPPSDKLKLAESLAIENGINFRFLQADDMDVDIDYADMLFIDSLHTYCHLTYELEKFSPNVKKYIVLHDTSPPWENTDDWVYKGNYSEYPAHINRNKRGLWPAVVDFLKNHPEWTLHARYLNNHGLTILKRR